MNTVFMPYSWRSRFRVSQCLVSRSFIYFVLLGDAGSFRCHPAIRSVFSGGSRVRGKALLTLIVCMPGPRFSIA